MGRILAQADPGPGEKIVIAPIDIASLRAERERRTGHHMLGHLRTETVKHARAAIYPGGAESGKPPTIAGNERAISEGKKRWRQSPK